MVESLAIFTRNRRKVVSLICTGAVAIGLLLVLQPSDLPSVASSPLSRSLSPAQFAPDALPRLTVDRFMKGLQRPSEFLVRTSTTGEFAAAASRDFGKFLGDNALHFTVSKYAGTGSVRRITGCFEFHQGNTDLVDSQATFTVVMTERGWRVSDAPFLALAASQIAEPTAGVGHEQ
jgi:hypothetical protein